MAGRHLAWVVRQELGFLLPDTAWEVAARYDRYNFDTGSLTFGATEVAGAINYYVDGHSDKVTLDASKSHDPDGRIKNFAFDLDGNGSMEVNNGKSPILKRKLSRGVHHVAVRVIDSQGLRAFANRTITVSG